jgi:hypothetical protein
MLQGLTAHEDGYLSTYQYHVRVLCNHGTTASSSLLAHRNHIRTCNADFAYVRIAWIRPLSTAESVRLQGEADAGLHLGGAL